MRDVLAVVLLLLLVGVDVFVLTWRPPVVGDFVERPPPRFRACCDCPTPATDGGE